MRFLSIITFLMCALGCTTQTPPTDAGPAPDVPEQDAHIPDAGNDSGPWTSEWLEEPIMHIMSTRPCEEWDAMPRMERALPADSTPRVLWYNFPPLDPGYVRGQSQDISIVDSPTLAPDGTIWTIGPGLGQISHIDRAGALIQTYRVTGRFEEGGLGPLVVAPDGSVLVAATGTDEDHTVILGAVFHVPPLVRPHPREERPSAGYRGISFPFGDRAPDIAIGPGGMVYIAFDGEITATCRGERVMWRLKQASARPDEIEPSILMRVRPNGDLAASFFGQRIFIVAPDGSISFEYDADLPRSWIQAIGPATPTARTIQLYDPAAEPPNRLMVYHDGVGVELEGNVRFSPTDDAWYWVEQPRQPVPNQLFRRAPPEYIESTDVSWSQTIRYPSTWLPDGGRLLFGPEPDDEGPIRRNKRLTRLSRDGEVQWDINVVDPGVAIEPMSFSETNWVIDDSGVVYVRAFFTSDTIWALLAIQTDSLPPTRDTCVYLDGRPGCNAQRDQWLRAE